MQCASSRGVGGNMSSDIFLPMFVKPEVGGGGGWFSFASFGARRS